MTSAKQLFLRKEPGKQSLTEWWVTVCHDERFQLVCTYARADMMEQQPTQPEMKGAEIMLATLLTLPDNEESVGEYPNPGLQHRMPTKKLESEPPVQTA